MTPGPAPAVPDPETGHRLNRDSYNAIAPDWDAARHAFYGPEQRWLDLFLDGLAVPSHILDLGCGTGRPIAEYVLARGHRLTGVDQAEKLLDLARARLPHGRWIAAPIENFEPDEPCDGVLCWDALFHLGRARHAPLLARISRALPPGGRLMLTLGGSAHPAFTDTMFGRPFFYDSLTPEQTLSTLRELGFTMQVAEYLNPPTGGRDKGRYAIVARKT